MSSATPLRGAIVAMNSDRIIGLDGDLPWHYSADLKRFKRRTIDSTIIMGRITWESIGSKPLPKRLNIVVSRSPAPQSVVDDQNVMWFAELGEALAFVANQDAWIIGGGQLYAATIDWLNLIDVTIVPDNIERADVVKFPHIDSANWTLTVEQPLEDDPRLLNRIYQRTA